MSLRNTFFLILAIFCCEIPLSISIPNKANGTKEECGKGDGGSRAKVGVDCDISYFPWMVGFRKYGKDSVDLVCSSSLISDNYLLTQAHCFTRSNLKFGYPYFIVVKPGVTDQWDEGITHKIKKIIIHEKYGKPSKFANDIALIELEEKVKFTEKIRPICLPGSSDDFINKQGASVGWDLGKGRKTSYLLRKVSLTILNFDKCGQVMKKKFDETIICGQGQGNKDTCKFYGSLVVSDKEKYKLVGIVSSEEQCGTSGNVGIFTNVKHYLNWIKTNAGDIPCKG